MRIFGGKGGGSDTGSNLSQILDEGKGHCKLQFEDVKKPQVYLFRLTLGNMYFVKFLGIILKFIVKLLLPPLISQSKNLNHPDEDVESVPVYSKRFVDVIGFSTVMHSILKRSCSL